MTQAQCRTIVVVSNCPEDSGQWVRAHYPEAQVVDVEDGGTFNLSKCRNAGLQQCQTKWTCFVDADVVISELFYQDVLPQLKEGFFYKFEVPQEKFGLDGTVIVETDYARLVEGYDEVFEGWGGEDGDFYTRLDMSGVQRAVLSHTLIDQVLVHSHTSRTTYYKTKDIRISLAAASVYITAKTSLSKLAGNDFLNEAHRRKLFALAQSAVNSALARKDKKLSLILDVPKKDKRIIWGINISQKIVVDIDLSATFK